ncbi:hypothetical protein V1477_017701 [Vespula maculifrons]|uniref:Uncharacterized protein n=2 Tax=Vespula TaxID=7451 RepID=A0A834K4F9_VESVU|nr:hypothetical protein HZH66_005438 [Vespula vulgaris]
MQARRQGGVDSRDTSSTTTKMPTTWSIVERLSKLLGQRALTKSVEGKRRTRDSNYLETRPRVDDTPEGKAAEEDGRRWLP